MGGSGGGVGLYLVRWPGRGMGGTGVRQRSRLELREEVAGPRTATDGGSSTRETVRDRAKSLVAVGLSCDCHPRADLLQDPLADFTGLMNIYNEIRTEIQGRFGI